MIWGIIILLIVALDQITKHLIVGNIQFGNSIPIINKFFYLTYWENKGAAWGMFQNGRYVFIPLTLIISVVIFYYIYKMDNKLLRLSLSFVMGGAFGNLIDRVAKGSVTDFFHFYFGSYEFPIFNVADSFVVIGTFLLAYYFLFVLKDKPADNVNKKD